MIPNVETKLDYVRASVAVLRTLQVTNKTMKFEPFCRAIGLIPDKTKWNLRYRAPAIEILDLAAIVDGQAKGMSTTTNPLQFERLVDDKGKPLLGFYKRLQVVRDARA